MDGDTKPTKENNGSERYELDASDVLPSIWVRLFVQIDNGLEWFLLGGRYYFLLYFRMLLAILFLAIKTPEIIKLVNQF